MCACLKWFELGEKEEREEEVEEGRSKGKREKKAREINVCLAGLTVTMRTSIYY